MTTNLVRGFFSFKPLGHGWLSGGPTLRGVNRPNYTKVLLCEPDNLLFVYIGHALLRITFTKKFLPFLGGTSR